VIPQGSQSLKRLYALKYGRPAPMRGRDGRSFCRKWHSHTWWETGVALDLVPTNPERWEASEWLLERWPSDSGKLPEPDEPSDLSRVAFLFPWDDRWQRRVEVRVMAQPLVYVANLVAAYGSA
jgi:hypothetical protein